MAMWRLDRVACAVAKGQKKLLKRNGKAYGKLADHVGRYPVVMIAPSDSMLVLDGSEVRRKWMDAVISQYNRPYLDRLIQYHHLVQQRNILLRYFAENRTWDEAQLMPWDEQMVPLAESIAEERIRFLEEFTPEFQRLHQDLSGGRERVGLTLHTKVFAGRFSESLQAARDDDRRLRRCTVGIHKDDVDFRIGEHPLKRFGSQGQQKTFLLALRLAQWSTSPTAAAAHPPARRHLRQDRCPPRWCAHEGAGPGRLWPGFHLGHRQCPDRVAVRGGVWAYLLVGGW